MKAPLNFKEYKHQGLGQCIACGKWKRVNYFFHEGINWALCLFDYFDYWENTNKLLPDYNNYAKGRHW